MRRTAHLVLSLTLVGGCSKREPSDQASAAPPEPTACAPVTISIGTKRLAIKRDTATEITPDALETSLRDLAKTCLGPVTLVPSGDVAYQDVIDVMDLAVTAGFTDIDLVDSEKHRKPATRSGAFEPGDEALKQAPIVVVTGDGVQVAGSTSPPIPLDAADLAAQVQAQLAAALPSPDGIVIVQADKATRGKVITEVVEGARDAGFTNLLFAVKK